MTTYVIRDGVLIEKRFAPANIPDSSAPNVISDSMPETRHMATGRIHTSKAAFREDTRISGCIEVGNDPAITKQRKPIELSREKRRDDIRRTLYELRNGNR